MSMMFTEMFKSFFKKSNKNVPTFSLEPETQTVPSRQEVENKLDKLFEKEENSCSDDSQSLTSDDFIGAIELMSIINTDFEYIDDSSVSYHGDDTKSEVSSIGKNEFVEEKTEDPIKQKLINKINSLQCLFTWKLKSNKKRNLISKIQNKYGEFNLDISSLEFTFERFIGNLIIGYELFHKGDTELGQMKMLEIGKWLEDLDNLNNDTNELYLSINTGIRHVMTATFIHMLFVSNLMEECNWFLESIDSFANMNTKSRAAIHAIHAAILIEYDGNNLSLKNACKFAKKACDLDPNTAHWYYIYSLALTAQRHFFESIKSCPKEQEIIAIQEAIGLSDGQNTSYNYHRMTLDKDTIIYNFHKNINKSDQLMIKKNVQDNKTIVQMIKTIVSMKPKDPLMMVKCAQTLIHLPYIVRNLKLAKQYLKMALEMAPNDLSVLNAVSKTAEIFNKTATSKQKTTKVRKNDFPIKNHSKLTKELGIVIKKHKDGQNALPYLNNLLANGTFNENDKSKILAQICSYTILFVNDLKASIQHFIKLIEQQGMVNSLLIKDHFSSFGSKKFDLAELICNEIRLATNSSGTSSDDMLFYCKMLTKIIERCNLKIKDIDPSMKTKLIVDITTKSTGSRETNQNYINSSDNESDYTISKNKNKNHHKKINKTEPKVFSINIPEHELKLNKGAKKKNNNHPKTNLSNRNDSKNLQSNSQKVNTTSHDELKFKMSKFITSSDNREFLNKPNSLTTENIRNLQTQTEIENYTQQLYQNILHQNVSQQPYSLHNATSQGLRGLLNQNNSNGNTPFRQPFLQNPSPPPLLSLRPQIRPQNLQPFLKKSKKPSKNK